MVIQHNLSSMNANRTVKTVSRKKAKHTEKLSSGYRINRSADDAAGLAISEKMRRQIRGLTQASQNAQEGISLAQVADGAMAEIQEMLQRGSELSIKAANGTLDENDRKFIQEEIEQLKKEIDGISDRTTFNEIPVLKGNISPEITVNSDVIIQGGMPSWAVMGSQDNLNETYTTVETFTRKDNTTDNVTITHEAATIDFSAFDGSESKIKELVGNGFYTTCCTCSAHYSIRFTEEATNSMETSGQHYIFNIGIKDVQDTADLLNRIVAGTNNGNPNSHYTKIVADTVNGKLIIYDDRSNVSRPTGYESDKGSWTGWNNPSFQVTAGGAYGKFGPGTAYSADDAKKFVNPENVILQIGSEAGQQMKIDLPSISSLVIGIKSVDVSTVDGAKTGMTSFKNALQYVSEERSRMGAYQNRLEHTINNLDNVVENTQAAESLIRDTDMAKLMVEFSNSNILSQVGESMLAQANQNKQGILQLLG